MLSTCEELPQQKEASRLSLEMLLSELTGGKLEK